MEKRSVQAPAAVIMIRPHNFSPNWQTAKDNSFQKSGDGLSEQEIAKSAYAEATKVAETLEKKGINVHIF